MKRNHWSFKKVENQSKENESNTTYDVMSPMSSSPKLKLSGKIVFFNTKIKLNIFSNIK